jgi:Zn-dependent protease
MEEILNFLKDKMTIDEAGGDFNVAKVTGMLNPPIEKTIDEIKKYFSTTDYTPMFESEGKRHIVKFGIFKKVEDKPKYWLNILLFLATIVTATFGYYFWFGGLQRGVVFALSLIAILTCHELGHYFVSQKEGMITSLPYFIPVPFHFIGTFGAIIKMKSIARSRKSLLKVGMAGPIAGFLVALPISIIGIYLSEVVTVPEVTEPGRYLIFGDSLLFHLLTKIIHPNMPQDATLFIHPMGFAAWVGFLVTALNLIPIGQLDGGHVLYSILLKKRRFLYIPLLAGIVALGIFLFAGGIFCCKKRSTYSGYYHSFDNAI